MPRNGKVHREDAHGQHGRDKDPSRQHMAGGTFAETHCRGPGQQPQAPRANMNNQYGRIGHQAFLEIYTGAGAPVFHPTAISAERGLCKEGASWSSFGSRQAAIRTSTSTHSASRV